MPRGGIEVKPLAEAFLRSGLTPYEVARRLGWKRDKSEADASRVRRALGLALYSPGHGYPPRYRQHCTEEMAIKLARAIGVDPRDVNF